VQVFVSHATEDKPFVKRLLSKLPPHVHPWLDSHDLQPGEALEDAIRRSIERSHACLVAISARSLQPKPDGHWVAREVELAMERESLSERVYVLPVLIDPGLDLRRCAPPFAGLAERLYIDASDATPAGVRASQQRLAAALFQWLSAWIDQVEPAGFLSRFVNELEEQLLEYQKRIYEVKAAMAMELPALVKEDAVAFLSASKDRYNVFTDAFIPRLPALEMEIQRRFGTTATKAFRQLSNFITNDVFHGAAYALNDVITSVNDYEKVLSRDAQALAAAEERRKARLEALGSTMGRLVARSADYVSTLRA